MPTVLVTDANRGSAITIIRSLARRGWKVVAADAKHNSIGFRSRCVNHHYLYPSPRDSAAAFVMAMRQAVHVYNVDLIIPVTDDTLLPLAAARYEFSDKCQLAIAEDSALHLVTDKCATLRLAEQLDVPVPPTYIARSFEEASDVAHLIPWPLVLKAQCSRELHLEKGVRATTRAGYANNVEELTFQMGRFKGKCPVILQPYYEGEGQGVEMLAYEGRPLAAFQHRRLAEVPMTGGASALRESVPLNPKMYEYGRRLVEALHWTGLIMVEFKVNGGDITLIEINGRVWGSLPLAVHSGMDFPARLGDLYLNGPPPTEELPDTNYQVGVKVCNFDLMIPWIAQVLRGPQRYPYLPQPARREALKALLGFLDPRQRYDVQTLSDPMPGLMQMMHTTNRMVRKVRAKAREKQH